MTNIDAVKWLNEIEVYFQKLAIMSNEDIAIQSYIQNAFNANKIAKLIEKYNEH